MSELPLSTGNINVYRVSAGNDVLFVFDATAVSYTQTVTWTPLQNKILKSVSMHFANVPDPGETSSCWLQISNSDDWSFMVPALMKIDEHDYQSKLRGFWNLNYFIRANSTWYLHMDAQTAGGNIHCILQVGDCI